VPLMEWLRMDEAMREQVRRHDISTLQPARSLEAAARSLVDQGVTNEPEFRRIFGL
jgi:hypothetical protein